MNAAKPQTCCQHHEHALPAGCNQGRSCPARAEPIPRAADAMWLTASVLVGAVVVAGVAIVAHFAWLNWPIISALIF